MLDNLLSSMKMGFWGVFGRFMPLMPAKIEFLKKCRLFIKFGRFSPFFDAVPSPPMRLSGLVWFPLALKTLFV